MSKYRSGGKPDGNQGEIVKALRKLGAYVIIISEVSDSFDILVYFRGQTYSAEIKDGSLIPSKRKLRKGELTCKTNLESVGVKYWIINSVNEALEMIEKEL